MQVPNCSRDGCVDEKGNCTAGRCACCGFFSYHLTPQGRDWACSQTPWYPNQYGRY